MLALAGLQRCYRCNSIVDIKYITCPYCGNQLKRVKINGRRFHVTNINGENYFFTSESEYYGYKEKNKWITFFLCFFFGIFGIHKVYEEKIFLAVLYFLTIGLFGLGWAVDLILILFKPNTYYVRKK